MEMPVILAPEDYDRWLNADTYDACTFAYAAIAREHGAPVVTSDQMILRLFIWHDRTSESRLRLIVSESLCDLNYERLSDYEAIDLAPTTRR